eukprot:4031645-Amphidinium_carterae.1
MLFLSIEEPRLTPFLHQLQTIRQRVTDEDVINEADLQAETETFKSLSKIIPHRLLSMTEGEPHALVQSIHTSHTYKACGQLNLRYSGTPEARQHTKL